MVSTWSASIALRSGVLGPWHSRQSALLLWLAADARFRRRTPRRVAGCAALLKGGLMVHPAFLRRSSMSGRDIPGRWRPRRSWAGRSLLFPPLCGLWQSVQSPIAPGCCTLAVLDQLGHGVMAGHAQRLGVSLGEHHQLLPAPFAGGVAEIAAPRRKTEHA